MLEIYKTSSNMKIDNKTVYNGLTITPQKGRGINALVIICGFDV